MLQMKKFQKTGNGVTDFRASIFKLRGGIWTVLFFAVWFLAEPSGLYASLLGGVLVLIGQTLRFWAAGCIARYRGEQVGAQRLATWGPYSLVRNPLYVGNWFIGAGWGMIAGWKALLLFVVSFWVVYCLFIVPYEEDFLLRTFGEDYARYSESTGRFIPRSFSPERLRGPFDAAVLWRSERHSLLVTLLGTALLLFSFR